MFKKIAARIFLLGISLFFGFFLIELALRAYGLSPNNETLTIYEFSETVGWQPIKSHKYYLSTLYCWQWRYYNVDGLPTTKDGLQTILDKNTPSVAILGDSFAEGYCIPYEKSFAYVLDEKLADKQVVNLGVNGYSPDQYLMRARENIKKFNVEDIVVMFYPANDISYLYRQYTESKELGHAKPYFADNDYVNPTNIPLEKIADKMQPKNPVIRMIKDSSTYSFLRPIVRQRFLKNSGEEAGETEDITYKKEEMGKALGLIKQIKSENPGKNFFVYYIPNYSIDYKMGAGLDDKNIKTYQELCEELDLKCFTPESEFAKVDSVKKMYNIDKHDGHFSEEGSAVIAEHLYRILTQQPANQ